MDTISFLQTGYVICLSLAIMFFIISVVLFFVFDIRLIFNIRTGRAKRKTVEEMQKANSETGRLRANGRTLTSRLDGNNHPNAKPSLFSPPGNANNAQQGSVAGITLNLENDKAVSYTVRKTSYEPEKPANPVNPVNNNSNTNSSVDAGISGSYNTAEEFRPETSLLKPSDMNDGNNFAETSVLNGLDMPGFSETSLLSEDSGEFRILEKILLIHTEEIIC